ncbi:hypothetical protein WDU94_009855 [Cyamophila willieti]
MSNNLILGGDFNGRIGPYQSDEVEIFEGTMLSNERKSLDGTTNRRGIILAENMESHGLYVLNGRSNGDPVGNITFVNTNGKSVVDQVWTNVTNLPNIVDFYVQGPECCTGSDHFPVQVKTTMMFIRDINNSNTENRDGMERNIETYRWNAEKKPNT